MGDIVIMLREYMIRHIFALMSIYGSVKRRINFLRKGIFVASGTVIHSKVTIGRRTRINASSHLGNCEIGSYCAIGGRLVVRNTNHDYTFLNMQYFAQEHFFKCSTPPTKKTEHRVRIGHGAWIGDSVIILPGVSIGNGAVIGAGSIVTKNIDNYTVAVGNPARVIRTRFSPSICKALNSVNWWEWTDLKISENRWLFEQQLTQVDELQLLKKLHDLSN